MTRPDWNTYYMILAYTVAKRATCPRASVGAVLVKDNRILTTAYNGACRGLPHCTEVGCLIQNDHCVRSVHAECNAIIQAALHGVSTAGATAYITHAPCLACSKMLINAGVVSVVYGFEYRVSDDAMAMLQQANIGVMQYECQ